MNDSPSVLHQLMMTIQQRKLKPTPDSYTARLLAGGVDAIGAKIIEEAGEVVEAAEAGSGAAHRDHLIHEAADLVYHLLVLLAHREASLQDVEAKLRARFGISGLREKATRQAGESTVNERSD